MTENKCTAANKRFGVMRGVCSRKFLWEFESFVARPNFCVPPPAEPPTVGRKQQTSQRDNNYEVRKENE